MLDTIVDQSQDIPSPLSAALIEFYGGAINRVGTQDTAYPLRDATYALNAVAAWTDPSQDSSNIAWARGIWDAVQPFSPGSVYVNFLGVGDAGRGACAERHTGRTTRDWPPSKPTYDPTNLFHLNHNIKPAA